MLSNYKQALELISTLELELDSLKESKNITEADFERFLQEEKDYLARLKSPRMNVLNFAYVEALETLELAQ